MPWSTATVQVTLQRAQTPGHDWDASVHAIVHDCDLFPTVVASCWADGNLQAGLELYGCSDGGHGYVGSIHVCEAPGTPAATTQGWFDYFSLNTRVVGEITHVLTGDAVDEANVCG